MKELEKKLGFMKILLQALAIAEIVALVFIVVGAFVFVPLALFGAAMVVGGVVGGFALLFTYRELKEYKAVCVAIREKGIKETQEIAKEIKRDLPSTRNAIKSCFFKGLLNEYIRVGETVVLKEEYEKSKRKEKNPNVAIKCPNCGASFEAEQGEIATCPYCQGKINA